MKKFSKVIICLVLVLSIAVLGAFAFTACNKKDNTIIVATNAAFPPFEYKEGTEFKGIDMDIMAAFCADCGYTLKIEDMEFDSVVASVGKTTDIGAAALTVNDERKKTVNFSSSYYNASQVVIVKADNHEFDACTSVADVEAKLASLATGTKVGVQNGTTGEYYVAGDEDWGFDGYANLSKTGYTTIALAVSDLVNGNLGLVVVDEGPAKVLAASNTNIKIINFKLTDEDYAFAVDKGNADLLAKLNEWLANNQAKVNTIITNYFGA